MLVVGGDDPHATHRRTQAAHARIPNASYYPVKIPTDTMMKHVVVNHDCWGQRRGDGRA
jgi:hypothetical protein